MLTITRFKVKNKKAFFKELPDCCFVCKREVEKITFVPLLNFKQIIAVCKDCLKNNRRFKQNVRELERSDIDFQALYKPLNKK